MKMIPANVDFISDNESNAERKVFNIISKIENNFLTAATCFHSIRVPDHIKNDMGECDFLIISKGIIIALEVKGGRIKYDPESNTWLFINRNGDVNRKKTGPFQQADEVMYSIRDKLRKSFYELNNFLFIKGVVFPGTGFSIGVDRLVFVMNQLDQLELKNNEPVVICVLDNRFFSKYYELLKLLRDNDINSELYLDSSKNLTKQLIYADKRNSPVAVICGETEFKENKITLKRLRIEKSKDNQITIPKDQLINEIKKLI